MPGEARQEALSVLGNDPLVPPTSEQQAKELPYINAIIKEAIRLVPPVGVLGDRECTEPVEFQGRQFPTGTRFVPHIYCMQRSKHLWKDPDSFRPERFLDEENLTPHSWIPFGAGPRQCIGMVFSLMEQRVTLSMLLRKYRWSLPEASIHENGVLRIRPTGLLAPESSELCFEPLVDQAPN
ncbi:cytochrome P450 [Basidiobolus meristosporus CBS 931.73]|uniref:Cytochrome P450 n=1 Tax=Basidiobolus meristosporus CBS 931.73 TaxID=1314790 RepID=A0A1Y1Y3M5_9FUNG|nr:cytochrome P450 [Basidiobolus meristosporus CBS 931.73]|eukprot:ORX92593.1 cytochrome P450 [Basidiobolus meristosporus CBS 931.73]